MQPVLVRLWTSLLSLLLVCSAAAQTAQPTATYREGKLAVTLPHQGVAPCAAHLSAELLSPEGVVLATADEQVSVAEEDGSLRISLVPRQPLSFEEVVWQRVRLQLTCDQSKQPALTSIYEIAQILGRPVVRILGNSEYLAGSGAAVRVIVSDTSGTALPGSIHVELEAGDQPSRVLFDGSLNQRGTVEARLRFPSGVTGAAKLHFTAETSLGSTEYTLPVQLLDKASILLTTEKPIYQPSQTIHVRALALDRANHAAVSNRPVLFEVEDSRGNKVFKRSTATDRFGIASASFTLADEVNLGTYHLRAAMAPANKATADVADAVSTAEIALNVERYVLPKFKVAVEFAEKNGKPKHDYRPGEQVTGVVRANYFFGQPVAHAELSLKVKTADVAVIEAAATTGKTDADGVFHFDLQLPDYFAGKPLSRGEGSALVEASVKDSAAHTETRGEPITISQSAILLQAIPEGGTLVPGLDNQVYLLASYPDGSPAPSSLTVHVSGAGAQQVTTDATGAAVIELRGEPGDTMLTIDADDHHGDRVTYSIPLNARGGEDQILLRSSRAIFKPGDRIELRVLSTRQTGTAYVDIVRTGQTLLSRDLDLHNGEATLSVTATPEMSGTLDLDAYLFGRDAQPVADHRLVFVQPADELKVEAATDAAVYKPGGDARISFHVTNRKGAGVSAALGLEIVDEAVFALAEKQPGFAKTFFYLEQEVMKPRYEIHSTQPGLQLPGVVADEQTRSDLPAHILFAATELANPTRVDVEAGRELPQEQAAEYQDRYQQALVDLINSSAPKLTDAVQHKHDAKEFMDAFRALHLEDAWGTQLRIDPISDTWGSVLRFLVRSAGPDHTFDTSDDLNVQVRETLGAKGGAAIADDGNGPVGGHIDITMEFDRGAETAKAEVSGSVTDSTGAVVPQALVTLREIESGIVRRAHSEANGNFNFAGLPRGHYQVKVNSPGFEVAFSRDFFLEARQQAVLSAKLSIGSVTETVEVAAQDRMEVDVISAAAPALMAKGAMSFAQGAASGRVLMLNGLARGGLGEKQPMASGGTATLKEAATHVRSYFPEALYINPEIVTDGHGNASILVPVADSITTWRMAMLASTEQGTLGSSTGSLKVFQDFFVDVDLPVTLTQGDRVTLPIAIYNYSGKPGRVTLSLQPESWYTLEKDSAVKSVEAESNHVGGGSFTLNATHIGKFKLTLTAHLEGAHRKEDRDDVVVREIEVVPNGREQNVVFNGRLEHTAEHTIQFPAGAIPDASSVLVRLYPGPLSQVIEGMDSILRMPFGCFEQTSSSTYPNVLALDYMKRTNKLTPEVHAKAEGFIANGYQRLLTFEVPGGGFSWFGQAPANKILTAYGLMEFNDMAQVSEVDPKLIARTREWLASQQQPDGSWEPDTSFINEGATNRYNSNVLRITAYTAWALANTGEPGPAVARAKQYIESHSGAQPDAYTLAVIANFAAEFKSDPEFTRRAMQALLDTRSENGDQVSWTTGETGFNGTGPSASVETTGLAVQALLKWGHADETARKALNFITSRKDATGAWGTTQATIMALKALLLASSRGSSDTGGTLRVMLNGKVAEILTLTPDNNDLLHQFVFKSLDPTAPTQVQLSFEGTGGLAYQVAGRSFTPWENRVTAEALGINVDYDRTSLVQNDIATAKVTVHNNLTVAAKMVMIDLGIPPGFDILSEDLQELQEKTSTRAGGHLEKFSLTATQAILYFDGLDAHQTVSFKVRFRARFPIHAHTFASRVYEYYAPEVNATSNPIELEVSSQRFAVAAER